MVMKCKLWITSIIQKMILPMLMILNKRYAMLFLREMLMLGFKKIGELFLYVLVCCFVLYPLFLIYISYSIF
jgi:hypothetical protein